MKKELENDYKTSVDFWNNNYAMTDEEIKETLAEDVGPDDWKTLPPSETFLEALKAFKDCEKVLDYGCGYGWADITAVKLGCKYIKAVDVVENSKKITDLYAKVFGVNGQIDCEAVSVDWLSKQPADVYDGLFVSNVIDVVPMEVTEDILTNLKKVTKKGAKIIIGMNYYIAPAEAEKKGQTIKDGKYLFDNGVLRLMLLSDDEWTEVLSKYFKVEKLEHFAWNGESKASRRLFFLTKE